MKTENGNSKYEMRNTKIDEKQLAAVGLYGAQTEVCATRCASIEDLCVSRRTK